MPDGTVRTGLLAQATGGVNQLPAHVPDHNSFHTAGQGGDQTGSITRTKAGTIIIAIMTINQFFNPGCCTCKSPRTSVFLPNAYKCSKILSN